MFRRAAGASQAGVQGKGVGLALVRSIAQNYDGRAWVQSQLGHGSDFCFALNARRTAPGGENPFGHQTPDKTEFADAGHQAVD